MQQQERGRSRSDASSWERLAAAGRFEAIPAPFRWRESARFAHLLNGYTVMESDALGEFANERLRRPG